VKETPSLRADDCTGIRDILRLLYNTKLHNRFYNSTPLIAILSQMNGDNIFATARHWSLSWASWMEIRLLQQHATDRYPEPTELRQHFYIPFIWDNTFTSHLFEVFYFSPSSTSKSSNFSFPGLICNYRCICSFHLPFCALRTMYVLHTQKL
jgi:hypothetical protein